MDVAPAGAAVDHVIGDEVLGARKDGADDRARPAAFRRPTAPRRGRRRRPRRSDGPPAARPTTHPSAHLRASAGLKPCPTFACLAGLKPCPASLCPHACDAGTPDTGGLAGHRARRRSSRPDARSGRSAASRGRAGHSRLRSGALARVTGWERRSILQGETPC